MNIAKQKIILIIIIIAAFLRFYQLGINPPSLTWDEAAWGYNAYSIGINGKDEFGRFLPLDYLESFGDFKPPVYAYLDIIPVKIFGLNEFAVRFPSALFGVLTVLITYFLTKRIFSYQSKTSFWQANKVRASRISLNHGDSGVVPTPVKQANSGFALRSQNDEWMALLSAFFLAISPWHINLSRAAFEANIATFFLVCGVWLFLCGVYERKWCLVLSITSFVLSLYTFNTARVVAPILVLILVTCFRKNLLEQKKHAIIAVIIGILLILPTLKFFLSPQANLRFREVNIFSDPGVVEVANQQIANDNNSWWSKIIHNRRFAYGVEYLRHYFDNLSPSFLFIKGDGNPKFSTQTVGELYLWDLPFFIIGAFLIFKKREGYWWIVPVWLLVGIIPAATARETPHALRIETTIPTFQILISYGAVNFFKKISNIKYQISNLQIKYLIFSLCFLFLIFNFLYYYHGYYVHYPREYSGEWQYGYKESIAYVKTFGKNYKQIVVTQDLGRPYIYYLFYTKTDPRHFRTSMKVRREAPGFVHVDAFDKYIFARNFTSYHKFNKGTLYINTTRRVHPKASILKQFRMLNGDIILTAYLL